MAKLGQLMLQDGVWKGQKIVSSGWVRNSVSKAIPVLSGSDAHGYGYQWKLGRHGGYESYYASGWGSQFIIVLPDLNLVYVQTGERYFGQRQPVSYDTILEAYVLPAIRRK